jgi:hypothetical protein
MNAEFNVWLLIVGVVAGAGVVVLIVWRFTWPDDDETDLERWTSARWIAGHLAREGRPVDPATTEDILALHRDYLAGIDPTDDTVADAAVPPGSSAPADERWSLTPPVGPGEPGSTGPPGRT